MSKYLQAEFEIDVSQGSAELLPTWMKMASGRPAVRSLRKLSLQLPLFDITSYDSKDPEPKTRSRRDRNKRSAVSTSQPL
jgi:hypothetical protein